MLSTHAKYESSLLSILNSLFPEMILTTHEVCVLILTLPLKTEQKQRLEEVKTCPDHTASQKLGWKHRSAAFQPVSELLCCVERLSAALLPEEAGIGPGFQPVKGLCLLLTHPPGPPFALPLSITCRANQQQRSATATSTSALLPINLLEG